MCVWSNQGAAPEQFGSTPRQYLLSMHPGYNLCSPLVIQIIVDHPNLKITELIYSTNQPSSDCTFLTDACQVGGIYGYPPSNTTLPLIHYLLDNRTGPQQGSWRDCGALIPSIKVLAAMGHPRQDD